MAEQAYILDIDTKFLDNVSKIEQSLAKTAKTAYDFTAKFKDLVGAAGGFSSRMKALEEEVSKLGKLKMNDLGMATVAVDVKKAIDNTNILAERMSAFKQTYDTLSKEKHGMFVKKSDLDNIAALQEAIRNIREKLNSTDSKLGRSVQHNYVEQLNLYKQMVAEMSKSDKMRADEKAKEIQKEINDLLKLGETVAKINDKSRKKATDDDNKRVADLRKEYLGVLKVQKDISELQNKVKKYENKYGSDFSSSSKKALLKEEESINKRRIEMEREHRKALSDLIEQSNRQQINSELSKLSTEAQAKSDNNKKIRDEYKAVIDEIKRLSKEYHASEMLLATGKGSSQRNSTKLKDQLANKYKEIERMERYHSDKLLDLIKKREQEQTSIELTEQRRRERERQAANARANAQKSKNNAEQKRNNEAIARVDKQYETALRYSQEEAKSIRERTQAVKKLEAAQRSLQKSRMSDAEVARRNKEITDEIKRQKKEVKDLKDAQDKLKESSQAVSKLLKSLFAIEAIRRFVNNVRNVRGEFEMQHRSLQILLRDKDEANVLWNKVVDLAVKSPFSVKDLVTYTKQMAAYRIESSKLFDTTKMLADVSAGLGVDMSRLILAFGQVRAAEFLRGTELRQFTEAGVPMLEELAKHFSELEHRAVSTADVFERMSKRMVSFADVEAVFKKITSKGGIFYRMQEEQAKTLKGMTMNLKDQIDLMFNDIGKQNEGLMKSVISMISTLISKWKTLFPILAALAGAITTLGGAFLANAASVAFFNTSLFATEGAALAATLSLSKLIKASKTLMVTLSKNPWVILAMALAATVSYLYAYVDEVDELEEAHKERVANLKVLQNETNNYSREIINLTKKEDELRQTMKDMGRETEEYKDNTEKLLDIEKQKKELYEQLSEIAPEYSEQLKAQNNDTQKMVDLARDYNNELRARLGLEAMLKDEYGEVDEYKELQTDIDVAMGEIEATVARNINTAQKIRDNLSKNKSAYTTELKILERFLNSAEPYYKRLARLYKDTHTEDGYEKRYLSFSAAGFDFDGLLDYIDATEELDEATKGLMKSVKEAADNFKASDYGVSLFGTIANADATPEEITNAKSKIVENMLKTLDNLGLNGSLREKAVTMLEEMFDFEMKLPDPPLEPWAQRVTEAVKALNEKIKKENPDAAEIKLFPLPDPGQTKEAYKNLAKDVLAIADATYTANQQTEDAYDVARTNALKDYADEYRDIVNISKKTTDNGSKENEVLNKRIQLLKEVNSEYNKLRDYQTVVEAKTSVINSYKDTFAEAFKGLNLADISNVDFTTLLGLIDALKQLKPLAQKEGKEAEIELSKAISGVEVEIDVELDKKANERFKQHIEDMFAGYELAVELDKLDVPKDLARDLFNLEAVDLSEIRSMLEAEKAQEGIEKERLKIIEESLRRIDKLEDKAQQERLKKYVKYLVAGQGERVKIKLDEMRQIAEIESLPFDDAQKGLAREAVRAETNKRLEKLDWEEFKDSGMYVRLFEDLDFASSRTLKLMRERLMELKSQLGNLDADDLKHLYDQIEKLDNELVERNPFKALAENADEYFKSLKRLKDAEYELSRAEGIEERLALRVSDAKVELSTEKSIYEKMSKSKDVTSEDLKKQRDKITALNVQLDMLKSQLLAQGKLTKELEEEIDAMTKGKKAFTGSAEEIGALVSEAANALPGVAGHLENVFGSMSDGTRDAIDSIATIGGGIGDAIEGFASDNYVQAIMGVAQAIGGIFAIGDKAKERKIQRELKHVEELDKRYQEINEALDEVYNSRQMAAYTKELNDNIDSQIERYERMRALEADKKKSDKKKMEEYDQYIEDLNKRREEMFAEQQSKATAGILDDALSAAEGFVDAWYEAFKETGDGLSGLENNFKEMLTNLIKRQAAMQIAGNFTKQYSDWLSEYINAGAGDMELTPEDAREWAERVKETMPELSAMLENFFSGTQDLLQEQGELSELSKGIQGVTESTAQVLEALLNSMRFYVADSNIQLRNIANALISNDVEANPLLNELRQQTAMIRSIEGMFDSVIGRGGSSHSGGYVKVLIG